MASSRAVDEVDDLDRAGLAGAGLEQFLLAAADRPVAQLPLDDLQALLDLLLVHAGAVAAQEELADIGGHGVLPGELRAPGPCGRCTRRRRRRRSGRGVSSSIGIASSPDRHAASSRPPCPTRRAGPGSSPLPSRLSSATTSATLPSGPTGFAPAQRRRRVGGLVAEVDRASVEVAFDLDPAAQPGPADLLDFRGDARLLTMPDDELRDDAFLDAQPAVAVFLARDEAVDPVGGRDPHVLRPEPGEARDNRPSPRASRRAHRPQRVAVRYLGRSAFGSPPGTSSQP